MRASYLRSACNDWNCDSLPGVVLSETFARDLSWHIRLNVGRVAEVWLHDRRQADARRRRSEALEVLFEPKGSSAVHPECLERSSPPKQRLVVRPDDRLGRIDEPAARHSEGKNAHARIVSGTCEPMDASSGRAFVHDSSTSVAGSESQTMPPPTQR